MSSPAVGDLRWLVTLATRKQSAPEGQTGILETYTMLQSVHADIQPIRPMTYWASIQVDTPVTHMILLRWVDALNQTQAIVRSTLLRDLSNRVEIFRVRRIKELEGRKRFVAVEAELEALK